MIMSKQERELIRRQLNGRSTTAVYSLRYDSEGVIIGVVSEAVDIRLTESTGSCYYTGRQLLKDARLAEMKDRNL